MTTVLNVYELKLGTTQFYLSNFSFSCWALSRKLLSCAVDKDYRAVVKRKLKALELLEYLFSLLYRRFSIIKIPLSVLAEYKAAINIISSLSKLFFCMFDSQNRYRLLALNTNHSKCFIIGVVYLDIFIIGIYSS